MQTAVSSSPDIFLSYSHKDRKWVQELAEGLRKGGVKTLIDEEDFPIGGSSMEAMADAVARSRHTLLVLTPDWVASSYTRYEGMMALTSGPMSRRVLPLLLKDCEIPQTLRGLVYLDFRQPSRRGAQLERLLRQIGATAPLAEPVAGEPVGQSLVALGDLMQEPLVRDSVVASKILFQRVRDKIGIVDDYKKLHDLLHVLQLYCYDRLVQEAKRFPHDDVAASNLRDHARTMRSTIGDLRLIEQRASLPPGELSWIERGLEPALELLNDAVDNREPRSLGLARSLLQRVLTSWPAEINARLNDAARDLPLAELIREMTLIGGQARSLGLDPEKVRQLEDGAETLGRLNRTLDGLVTEHDLWQEIEGELRLMEWDGTIDAIRYSWSRIRPRIALILDGSAELWAVPLRQEVRLLDEALAGNDQGLAEDGFRSFRREVSIRFHQVDLQLRDQCEELQKVTEPLNSLLKRIES